MAGRKQARKPSHQPSLAGLAGVGPSRSVIQAGPKAVAAWAARVKEAEALALLQQRERAANDRVEVRAGVSETVDLAEARCEEVEVGTRGVVVISRDGLEWLLRKGKIERVYHAAGLRFRGDYETANGTGVQSCLRDAGGSSIMGPKSGPTDSMIVARERVLAAYRALGSPMLRPYVELIAGQGVMLNDSRFVKDERRVGDHWLPVRIAFDMLARHYGMIR